MTDNNAAEVLLDTLRAGIMTFAKALLSALIIFGIALTDTEMFLLLALVDAGINLLFLGHRVWRVFHPAKTRRRS